MEAPLVVRSLLDSIVSRASRRSAAHMEGAHTWERKRHRWESGGARHDDEDDDDELAGGFWGDCSDSDDEGPEEPTTAGGRVVEIISMHMILGNLIMRQAVTSMYWLAQAGIAEAKKWGLNPNNEGGELC